MANKMVSFLLFTTCILLLSVSSQDITALELNPMQYPPMECYGSQLNIQKHTLATTDSYRDTEMVQLIFPEAILEYIPHFHQDECARASKLYLPYTCFKIHNPQTWQLEQGYLEIKTLEHEYSKKFYAVIHGHSEYTYDAFFDNNVAFWVSKLDKYLSQINDNSHVLTHYLGLQWTHDTLNQTFYSLLIQSPHSQRIFELISFEKPNLKSYPNLRTDFKFEQTSVMRASFAQYPPNEYPWTGYVGTVTHLGLPILPEIVPVRISYAVSDLDAQIAFYSNVLEATVLSAEYSIKDALDADLNGFVSYAFVQPKGSVIELQFVERPSHYTYGQFSVDLFRDLLTQTHRDRISGVYCGLDRWFDNHFGYDTSMFMDSDASYMDRVFFTVFNMDSNVYKYRIYYIGHQRDEAWVNSDSFEIDDVEDLYGLEYKLYLFDPNGQTIQMIGYFAQTTLERLPPTYNKQWCATQCPGQQEMGAFDAANVNVYVEDEEDIVYRILFGDKLMMDGRSSSSEGGQPPRLSVLLVVIISVVCFLVLGLFGYCAYVYCQRRGGNSADMNTDDYGEETQCLLPK